MTSKKPINSKPFARPNRHPAYLDAVREGRIIPASKACTVMHRDADGKFTDIRY